MESILATGESSGQHEDRYFLGVKAEQAGAA